MTKGDTVVYKIPRERYYTLSRLFRWFKYPILSLIFGVFLMCFGIIFSHVLKEISFGEYISVAIISSGIILIMIGIFFVYIPITEYLDDKNLERGTIIAKLCIRVDKEGIWFLPYKKHWPYEDIEFVLIDESYYRSRGIVLIKTKQYRHLKVTPELLKKSTKILVIHNF